VVLTGSGSSTLTKLNDLGASLWTATVDGNPGAVFVAPRGDTLAMANVAGTEPVDPQIRFGAQPRRQGNVTRWDARGKLLWLTTISDGAGDLSASFVSAGIDGDVVVAGSFRPDMPPSAFPNPPFIEGGFLARLSSSGQQLWERHFVNPGSVRGFVQDLRGRTGVIFWLQEAAVIDGLMLQPKGLGWSGFLVWFDAAGRAGEAFDVTEDPGQRFSAVVRDDEGRLYVTGFVGREALGSSYTSEFFVSAFGATGDRLWNKRFNLGDQVDDSNLAIDECGDVLLVGNSMGTSRGILAARMTRDGEVKAQTVVPVSLADYVGGVAPAPGGIFFTGARDNNQTLLLARLDL
jgi:outer membrane protein assembly factor BamB